MSVTTEAPRTAAPHQVIWSLAEAAVPSRALHLVAELGVADQLPPGGTATGTELASRCGVDGRSLDRVLALLSAHGIFDRDGGQYRHNAASSLLRSDHPASMRAFARLNSLPVAWQSITALDHAVRSGRPGVMTLDPGGFYAYLGTHPDEAQVFGQAMAQKARQDIADLLAAYDFSPYRTVADIGGGQGHLLEAVVAATPGLRGVLFDLPEVISEVTPRSERVTTAAGDFFYDALPSADLYVVMEIIHDWPDREAEAILSAVRRAAEPGASVLIVEHVAVETGVDMVSQTLDVLMLAVTGGLERTPAEFASLLGRAGFQPSRVVRTDGPISAVEAVAV